MVGNLLHNAIYAAFEFFLSSEMLLTPVWLFLVDLTAFVLGLMFVFTTFFLPFILLYKALNKGGR